MIRDFFSAIERWLVASLSEQGDDRRQGLMLIRFAGVISAITLVMAVKYGSAGGPWLGLGVVVWVVPFAASIFLIRLTGRVRVAQVVYLASFFALFQTIVSMTGGIVSPNLVATPLVILMAMLLVGVRGAAVALVVHVVATISLSLRTEAGFGVVNMLDEAGRVEALVAEPIATGLAVFGMALIYETIRKRMVARIEAARQRSDVAHQNARLILDNAGQGFVATDLDGRVVGEHSKAAARWLGVIADGDRLADVLSRQDDEVGLAFALGLEMLAERALPEELVLDQFPSRLRVDPDRHLQLEYRPIHAPDSEDVQRLVVIFTDVTAQLAREQAELEQRSLLEVFARILDNRSAFVDFVEESQGLVDALESGRGERADRLRWLHTLKGNCALNGLMLIARVCHDLEDEIVERAGDDEHLDFTDLARQWRAQVDRMRPLLEARSDGEVVLDAETYGDFLRAVVDRRGHVELAHEVRQWTRDPVRPRLEVLAEHARELGQRLGKGELDVHVDASRVRVEGAAWRPLWSNLVHVVRNAVDHGIESAEERRALGKPERGRLELRAYEGAEGLAIVVADDGRGIDWAALRERAVANGLAHTARADLERALFVDGVSTRTEATETSGRGVGTAAVLETCLALGGSVRVHSEPGRGTAFTFVFPRASALVAA